MYRLYDLKNRDLMVLLGKRTLRIMRSNFLAQRHYTCPETSSYATKLSSTGECWRGKWRLSHSSGRQHTKSTDCCTNRELAGMHLLLVCEIVEGNEQVAIGIYRELVPYRQQPHYNLFARLHHNMCEYGPLRRCIGSWFRSVGSHQKTCLRSSYNQTSSVLSGNQCSVDVRHVWRLMCKLGACFVIFKLSCIIYIQYVQYVKLITLLFPFPSSTTTTMNSYGILNSYDTPYLP